MSAIGFEGREGPEPDGVPPLGLVGSAALFGAGALLLFLTTRPAVPMLVSVTGAEPVVMWFLAASALVFGPLLLLAALLLLSLACVRWPTVAVLGGRDESGGRET